MGCIRYCLQAIGQEQKTPGLSIKDAKLTEAQISSFTISLSHRNQGIGTQL